MPSRSGGIARTLAIAAGLLIAAVGLAAFWIHRTVTRGAALPLDIPDVNSRPEVVSSLRRRLSKLQQPLPTVASRTPGSPAPAGPEPESIPITGEELTLLLTSVMPPVADLRFRVDVADGLADLKLSLPAKEVTRRAGPRLGALAGYIESNVAWFNAIARASVRFQGGKLGIGIKEVREPSYLSRDQLQRLVDGVLAEATPGPLVGRTGEYSFQVLEMDLEGPVAVVKIVRLASSGAGDGGR
jgi:hypothetical protein